MPIRLHELLAQAPKKMRERVDQTCKRLNRPIREAIRKATGLTLNFTPGNGASAAAPITASVHVRIQAGVPAKLKPIEFEDHFRLLPLVMPFQRDLEIIHQRLPRLDELLGRIAETPQGSQLLANHDNPMPALRDLIERLLEIVNEADPVREILAVNTDVLGSYRALDLGGEIEIYWGILWLVAESLNLNLDALTGVVLAHELAHAYTNLGADIDGHRWDTKVFNRCETPLAEGLAQYYTWAVCQSLEPTLPGTCDAYERLLEKQPDDYHTHQGWVEQLSPEIVRLAMLEARRSEIDTIADFDAALKRSIERLGAVPTYVVSIDAQEDHDLVDPDLERTIDRKWASTF
jgi:hypothetical protein